MEGKEFARGRQDSCCRTVFNSFHFHLDFSSTSSLITVARSLITTLSDERGRNVDSVPRHRKLSGAL